MHHTITSMTHGLAPTACIFLGPCAFVRMQLMPTENGRRHWNWTPMHGTPLVRVAYYAVVSSECCAGSLHVLCCWHLGDKLQELICLLDMGHLLRAYGIYV